MFFWKRCLAIIPPMLLQPRNLPNWTVKRYFEVATSHVYNLAARENRLWVEFCRRFLFGDSEIISFTLTIWHMKKQYPQPILNFWVHNSTSPISPTPGKRRTVSTKLPACRRCNAQRSLNSKDTEKALGQVGASKATKVGQKTPSAWEKPQVQHKTMMFLGFKTPRTVAF